MAAYEHAPWMYWVGVITAGMTAFYVFRAMFMTFFGNTAATHHPHESPAVMTVPLVVLARALARPAGSIQHSEFLEPMFPLPKGTRISMLMAISVGAGLLGIALAYLMYVAAARHCRIRSPQLSSGLYKLVYNKYFVDEIYDAAVVQPAVAGSRDVLWQGVDAGVIDGVVNGVGRRRAAIGGVLRLLQSGNIRSYATWVVLGSVVC